MLKKISHFVIAELLIDSVLDDLVHVTFRQGTYVFFYVGLIDTETTNDVTFKRLDVDDDYGYRSLYFPSSKFQSSTSSVALFL